MPTYSVAIIGGGIFGSGTAQKLASLKAKHDISITVFSLHEYATIVPASVRLATGGLKAEQVAVKYSEFLDKSVELKVVKEITQFDEHSVSYVKYDSSEKFTSKFDVIVLSTGVTWYDPINYDSIVDPSIAGFESYNNSQVEKVKKAKKIVVAGGGEVGCELVGEYAYTFRNEIKSGKKELYLVHSDKSLLHGRVIDKVRKSVYDQLTKFGVKIILNEKVNLEQSTGKKVVLSSGTVIKDVDVLYGTIGPKSNLPHTDLDLVDDQGFVKINDKLQSQVPSIFAVGDVTNLETKSLLYLDETIEVVTHNIILHLEGNKNFKKYTKFISKTELRAMCGVSLGPTAAAGQFAIPIFGVISLPSFPVVRLKSKNMFTDHREEFFPHVKK